MTWCSRGVLWIDEAGRIQNCNSAAASILGYSRKALLKASYFEVNPHFSMLHWKRYWNRLRENNGERIDTEFVNRAGKLFTIRGRAGFDLYAYDPELCIIVFNGTEKDRRNADLIASIERDADIGSWEVNLTNNQVYVSGNVRRWLGLGAEREVYSTLEFLGFLHEWMTEDDFTAIRTAYKELREREDFLEYEIALRGEGTAQSSEPNRYRIRAESVANELDIFKVYGTLRLVVPVAEAGTPQSAGEQLMQLAVDRQKEAVYIISYRDRRIIYANDRASEFTGVPKGELIGMQASELVEPARREETGDLYDQLRDRQYLEMKSANVHRDGGSRTHFSQLYYRKRDNEEYMLVVSHPGDGSEPTSENVQLYASTLDALNDWVIWLDPEDRIVLLNEAARRKLRRKTSQDLNGMVIHELMPDLEIPPLAEVRQERIDGRRRSAVDYVHTNASREDRTLQVRFRQVHAGNQFFLCVICRDVTSQYTGRRRLQETKRRVDELTKELQSENENLREQIERVNTGSSIITVSKKYRKILGQIAQVADTDATVLVTGETGTGKELLAQSLHRFSRRSERPMVSVNCAALPENLIESELFGHERGAFTGAVGQKKGKFELADGSTIFLDEIGELPLEMQSKLLRVLQEGEIQRIGSTSVIQVDVRVVAATNRNLERMISEGKFREDLFYRLNVFPIHNPPLRERREDIPVLVKHFAKVYAERMGRNITHINPQDVEQLLEYQFPGNVRELINLVERAVITSSTTTLNLSDSLRSLRRTTSAGDLSMLKSDNLVSFEEMQKLYIIEALKRTGGKVTGPGGAADMLEMNGRTLMSKMNKLGINRNKFTAQ